MTIDTKKSVGEIAAKVPGAVKVLEAWGVDYCCGGGRSFERACAEDRAPLKIIQGTLEMELFQPTGDGSSFPDWDGKSCSDIIRFILREHHSFTRDQGRRLMVLAGKVVSEHGGRHPELLGLKVAAEGLIHQLEDHMAEEEEVVFPLILKAEEAITGGSRWLPPAGAEDYLETLQEEHALIGKDLQSLRQKANGFTFPADSCGFQREFYDGLQDLERDLHHHVHLENNILFGKVREAGILA